MWENDSIYGIIKHHEMPLEMKLKTKDFKTYPISIYFQTTIIEYTFDINNITAHVIEAWRKNDAIRVSAFQRPWSFGVWWRPKINTNDYINNGIITFQDIIDYKKFQVERTKSIYYTKHSLTSKLKYIDYDFKNENTQQHDHEELTKKVIVNVIQNYTDDEE
jgi:hypothetical protein